MSLKSAEKSPSLTQNKPSKKSYLLAFAFSAGSLLTGLAATGLTAVPVASQAAGLGDLFSSDKSATQPKFLPVDEAFQVSSSSKPTNNGKGAKNVPVVIGWQGCAKAGLCYPPEKIKTTVNIGTARK